MNDQELGRAVKELCRSGNIADSRQGNKWSDEEEDLLRSEITTMIKFVASTHRRGIGSICSRILALNLIGY